MHPITDPTALADQLTAAARDAHTRLADIAAHIGAPITPGPIPAWLTDHYRAIQEALHRGEGDACPHLDGGPTVAYAAVWAPARLACQACAPTFLHPDNPTEDMTCDRCRRTADGLATGVLAIGPFLLAFGLCPPCHHATCSSTTPPTSTPPDSSTAPRPRGRVEHQADHRADHGRPPGPHRARRPRRRHPRR